MIIQVPPYQPLYQVIAQPYPWLIFQALSRPRSLIQCLNYNQVNVQQLIQVKMLVHILYNNTNINTKDHWQHAQSYMWTYPIQQSKHNYKVLLPNAQYYMITYPLQQHKHKHKESLAKIPILICLNTLYNNTNIKTMYNFQHSQSSACTYPLQHHKHKHKGLFPKFPTLNN